VDVAAEAVPLPLGASVSGTIAPFGATYYQISSSEGGELSVMLQSPGFPAQVSIVDGTGQPLVQSDGSAAGGGGGAIDENVPAGIDLLEVQSLGAGGTYQITADLIPTDSALEPIPSQFTNGTPIGVGDFYGNGVEDLVAPDGIHLGVGDGTFQSTVVDGPLGEIGWTVTAIAVGNFGPNGLPDIAFAETSPGGSTANVCVLQNKGGGRFQPVDSFAIAPHPDAITTLNLGDGIVDLAVADHLAGTVATFVGDGNGGFTPGPILPGGSYPVALVAGQLGDGHVDLIVADQGDSLNGEGPRLTVFQNDGPGQFYLSARIPLGATPSAVAAGDFGNGNLDLAIANNIDNDVSVLLGNRDGTFDPRPSTYPVGIDPVSLVACALRPNGPLDLVTVNKNSADVSVLLGNGDGTFQPQTLFGVGSFPESLVVADFNGDHRPDLAVGCLGSGASESGEISVLLGRGDGTFQDQLTDPVGSDPVAVVTADLNHDGHPDIITTNYYSNDISVLLGNGDGTFQPAESFPAGYGPTGIVVGDFNGDGRVDVAVADSGNSEGDGQGVSILLGNGDGTFQSPVFYPAGTIPWSIVAGDFTGNGILDLAVANLVSDDVTILIGDGHGGFDPEPAVPIGDPVGGPISIAAGDFTGDGALDLAVANQTTDTVSILQGDGRGGFHTSASVSLGGDPLITSMQLVAGDFAGNGLSDLAVASASLDESDSVSIIPGSSQGMFVVSSTIPLGIGLSPSSITTGHFFGAGPLDLAVADADSDQVSLLRGDGTGAFDLLASAIELGGEGSPIAITTGDFTGDGELDLAVGLQSPNSVAIELNQGNGQFAAPGPVGLAPHNTPVVADFSGDGVPDVAVVDGAGNILFRAGVPGQPGTFDPPITVNVGHPSRDIAAVTTSEGTLLASVDATDNAVSVFGYHNGQFIWLGKLSTGALPAQIVSADLEGNGLDDLVIRNAGDGSLTIYMGNGLGWFTLTQNVPVGPGVADISVADVNQDGLRDILLANQTTGEVEVMLNQGTAGFGPPTLYRAGTGLSAVSAASDTAPLSLTSLEGTVGVAGAPTSGGPPDIVALNAGSDTIGVLDGLGGGRFANPISLQTNGPTLAVADLNDDGSADLAVLGPDDITIWVSNGAGGFVPSATYPVGPDPTALTVADVYGNGRSDLLVGNAFGDVLVLLQQANGSFSTPAISDQTVSLAADNDPASGGPTFVIANQAADSVVVQNGTQGKQTVLADRTTGLKVPGTPVLADLSGNGIMDAIILNSGGNSVLVFPGLPGGGFGPALNDGNGFFVGTNPVAVIVAKLNGRPDLIVADRGSDQISILLNEPQGNSFTFTPGPRLNAGIGPVGLAYGNFLGSQFPDIAVSDSGSKDVMVLPGLGNGFFDDINPIIVPLAESPGPIFAGSFGGGRGTDIVALDPGTGSVTEISGLLTAEPTTRTFSSGGLDPVAALTIAAQDGFDDLVVANNADGQVALLAGGPLGLSVEEVSRSLDLLSPTGLALASFQNDTLTVYATAEGQEAASLLVFSLGGTANPLAPAVGGLALLPLQESSLPLIATLLNPNVDLNQTEAAPVGAQAVTPPATATNALGQGPFGHPVGPEEEEDDGGAGSEGDIAPQSFTGGIGRSAWMRAMIGLEEAFEEFRREAQTSPPPDDGSEEDEETFSPIVEPLEDAPKNAGPVHESGRFEILDEALNSVEESGRLSAVTPTFGYDRSRGMTEPRPGPGPLAGTALSLLPGGLLLSFAVPTRRGHGSHTVTARARTGKSRSGALPIRLTHKGRSPYSTLWPWGRM